MHSYLNHILLYHYHIPASIYFSPTYLLLLFLLLSYLPFPALFFRIHATTHLHRILNNTSMTYFFSTAIWNDSKMKICYMFNVKLVTTNLQKKFQLVLSHSSQLSEKIFLVLECDIIKRWVSVLLWCKNIFVVVQDQGLEWCHESCKARDTLFISVNKKFEKLGLRLILLVKLTHFFSIDYSLSKVTQQSKVAPPDGTQYFNFLSESCFLSHKSWITKTEYPILRNWTAICFF